MVEQKAAVAMMEIEQSELNRVSEAFGYHLISTSRLTGGYASSNFAAVLRPRSGDAGELTAVLKFSYAAMPREEIEHQLTVLRALERHGFATNYLLPKLAAAPDAGLCERYLVTAEDGGGPWVILVTFCAGTAGDKLLASAAAPVEGAMLESLGLTLTLTLTLTLSLTRCDARVARPQPRPATRHPMGGGRRARHPLRLPGVQHGRGC